MRLRQHKHQISGGSGIDLRKTHFTEPGGYKFLSRNEARWAAFFDAVGLPYDYKKEGSLALTWNVHYI